MVVKALARYLALIFCACVSAAAANFYGVTDPHMGQYEGFWETKSGARGRVTAQVRPLSNNQYDGFVLLNRSKTPVAAFRLEAATAEEEGVKFTGSSDSRGSTGDLLAAAQIKAELKEGKLAGSFSGDLGEGTFEASRVGNESRTMGMAAPLNAVVLFDGKGNDAWEDFRWKVTKEGFLEVGQGSLVAKEKMGSFRLHLEFRTPYMPTETGQARGNSGVYLQGKYEVQVLDSFGLYPLRDNDCGGIYKVQAPKGNALFPPMEWQTYDITFREGGSGSDPTITVVHNGVTTIHEARVPSALVKTGTGGGVPNGSVLMLQDHGNPVQYRNIWVESIPAR